MANDVTELTPRPDSSDKGSKTMAQQLYSMIQLAIFLGCTIAFFVNLGILWNDIWNDFQATFATVAQNSSNDYVSKGPWVIALSCLSMFYRWGKKDPKNGWMFDIPLEKAGMYMCLVLSTFFYCVAHLQHLLKSDFNVAEMSIQGAVLLFAWVLCRLDFGRLREKSWTCYMMGFITFFTIGIFSALVPIFLWSNPFAWKRLMDDPQIKRDEERLDVLEKGMTLQEVFENQAAYCQSQYVSEKERTLFKEGQAVYTKTSQNSFAITCFCETDPQKLTPVRAYIREKPFDGVNKLHYLLTAKPTPEGKFKVEKNFSVVPKKGPNAFPLSNNSPSQ
jgi:hypothetical protein